jgi:hypothetical protein
MKIQQLSIAKTPVKSLAPLKGSTVVWLELSETPVADLTPLKGTAWRYLGFDKTAVKDYAVLKGMSIESLVCPIRNKAELAAIKGIKGLLYLNGKDAAQVFKTLK